MVTTISPLVQGPARFAGRRIIPPWPLLWTIHTATSAAGGFITGLIISLAGSAAFGGLRGSLELPQSQVGSRTFGYALVTAVGAAAAVNDLGLVSLHLPYLHRQVQRHWIYTLPLVVTVAGFGLQLGAVFLTYVPFASAYVIALLGGFIGKPLLGAALLGICGASRALPLAVTGTALSRNCDARSPSTKLALMRRPVKRLLGLLSAALAGSAAALVLLEMQ